MFTFDRVLVFFAGVGFGAIAGSLVAIGWFRESGSNGRFYPEAVKAEWLPDGRNMRLIEDFAFVDPKGVLWTAPKESIVNGASIPQLFWSVIGGPYEGKYRNASVIHDVACETRTRPHQEVHRAFYDACICAGADTRQARLMYAAVAKFGPKWEFKEVEIAQPRQVMKVVKESRMKLVVDPATGEKNETRVEVEVPVYEATMDMIRVRQPVAIPVLQPTGDSLSELQKVVDDPETTLDFIGSLDSEGMSESVPEPKVGGEIE